MRLGSSGSGGDNNSEEEVEEARELANTKTVTYAGMHALALPSEGGQTAVVETACGLRPSPTSERALAPVDIEAQVLAARAEAERGDEHK